MRDVTNIILSSHFNDVATVLGVFSRREYGTIRPGSIIIDIGANIGLFSIYAAKSKASKIYSCEPSSESFSVLLDNVKECGFQDVIMPMRNFVDSTLGRTVKFPRASSGFNTEIQDSSLELFDDVVSLRLEDLIEFHNISNVDILKIDCEGSEYEIIFDLPEKYWSMIREIRMEYHKGRIDELVSYFGKHGFLMTRHVSHHPMLGLAWFERK